MPSKKAWNIAEEDAKWRASSKPCMGKWLNSAPAKGTGKSSNAHNSTNRKRKAGSTGLVAAKAPRHKQQKLNIFPSRTSTVTDTTRPAGVQHGATEGSTRAVPTANAVPTALLTGRSMPSQAVVLAGAGVTSASVSNAPAPASSTTNHAAAHSTRVSSVKPAPTVPTGTTTEATAASSASVQNFKHGPSLPALTTTDNDSATMASIQQAHAMPTATDSLMIAGESSNLTNKPASKPSAVTLTATTADVARAATSTTSFTASSNNGNAESPLIASQSVTQTQKRRVSESPKYKDAAMDLPPTDVSEASATIKSKKSDANARPLDPVIVETIKEVDEEPHPAVWEDKTKDKDEKSKPVAKKIHGIPIDKFKMNIGANPVARALMEPSCEQAAEIVLGPSEDPIGDFVSQIPDQELTNRAGVYYLFDRQHKLTKIGYTKNFQERFQQYQKLGFTKSQFKVALDFDMIDDDINDSLLKLYEEAKRLLLNCKDLHPCHLHFLRALFLHGGDQLGLKVTFMLQMIESGFQLKFGLPCPMEFLMWDEEVTELWYKVAAEIAWALYNLLPSAVREAGQILKLLIAIISSWATGQSPERISSTPMINECITSVWNDILKALYPNATTVEEMFSNDYSATQREQGRHLLSSLLNERFESSINSMQFVDSNNLVFGRDPNSAYKSIFEMLANEFPELSHQPGPYDEEITLYVHENGQHAAIVNHPFCVANDARDFITLKHRIARGMACAALVNLARLLKGKEPLNPRNPEDEFQNPINGMLCSMVARLGYHTNWMRVVVFGKHSNTPRSVNAFEDSCIVKTLPDAALTRRLRKREEALGKASTNSPFTINNTLEYYVRGLISRAKQGQEEALYHAIMELSKKDTELVKTVWNRWKTVVKKQFKKGSELWNTLDELREANKVRNGNPNATDKTKETAPNNDAVAELIRNHYGKCIWVRKNAATKKLESLGDGRPVFNALTFHSLRGRFTQRKRNGKTAKVLADKYPSYAVVPVRPEVEKDGYVLARLQDKGTTTKRSV